MSNELRAFTLTPDGTREGWLRACSQLAGVGSDNPANPMALTDAQRAKAMSVSYSDVADFRAVFAIGRKGYGGRNFLIGGASNTLPACADGMTLPYWGSVPL